MAQVMGRKSLSDGQIAVCLRPEGADSTSDSWHTITITGETTTEMVAAWLEERKTAVDAQYTALQNAGNLLDGIS